eukprot:SAG31_NODE_974_length_10627_cov_11.246201_14_plen_128_part_01
MRTYYILYRLVSTRVPRYPGTEATAGIIATAARASAERRGAHTAGARPAPGWPPSAMVVPVVLLFMLPRGAGGTVQCANLTCPRLQVPQNTTHTTAAGTSVAGCCQHKPLLPIVTADVQTIAALFVGL